MRIVFLKGEVPFLDFLTDSMMNAAEEMGIASYLIHTSNLEETAGEKLNQFVSGGSCIFFTFNNIGALLSEGNENFWGKYHVPIYSMLVDHPRNFSDLLRDPMKDLNILCIDKNHVDFCRRFYPRLSGVHFLPHGGTEVASAKPIDRRSIDILYLGDCQEKVGAFPNLEFFPDGGTEFYQRCTESLLKNPLRTTEEVVESTIKEYFPGIADEGLLQVFCGVSIFIEFVARRHFKQTMMHAIDDAGLSVEIYGDHWEDEDAPFSDRIHIHPRISTEECTRLIGDAKVNLNFIPWFKNGSNEKIYDGMLNRAAVFSDNSPVINRYFTDGSDILLFDYEKMDEGIDHIKSILSDEARLQSIADAGYENAKTHHSWKKRLEELLSIIERGE